MTAQTRPRCKTSKPEEESTRKQRQKGEDEKSKSTRISSEKKVGDGLHCLNGKMAIVNAEFQILRNA